MGMMDYLQEAFTDLTKQIIKAIISVAMGVLTAWVIDRSVISLTTVYVTIVVFLVATVIQVLLDLRNKHRQDQAYYVIALSEEDEFPNVVRANADSYFSRKGIAPASADFLTATEAYTPRSWRRMLERMFERVPGLIRHHGTLHLVCATPWLWAFALGTRLGETVGFQLYHFVPGGTFHPVWQGAESVRTLAEDPQLVRNSERLVEHTPGTDTTAAVLIVSIGRNIVEQGSRYWKQHRPDLPVWWFCTEELDPQNPVEWRQVAAELARAIDEVSEGGERSIY